MPSKHPFTHAFIATRRSFLYGAGGTLLQLATASHLAKALSPGSNEQNSLFVSPAGKDTNPGTEALPLKSIAAAQKLIRERKPQPAGELHVYLRSGTYYLAEPIVFTAADSGTVAAPIEYSPYPGEQVTLSGGIRLAPSWTAYRNGILQTAVPAGTEIDQLFVNGQRQILARYPNFDPDAKYLNGAAADAISPQRTNRWANPAGGYIHALHQYLWGDQHYQITGKDTSGNLTYEGGWQNNRPKPMHAEYRFVENIFEELDSPGEWFLDRKKSILYFYPPANVDMKTAVVETAQLKHLVEFRGTQQAPVQHITLRGFTFQHTTRTFMETREALVRSDWRIYRGGAIFLTGTEDCRIDACTLDQLGGNCIFVSNYNRRVHISGCHISGAGASGIVFLGDPAAVRNPLFNYEDRHSLAELDKTPGPLTPNYPQDCLVEDTLIYQTGRVEKQSAPIEIDLSSRITVRHCSLYDVPRAGINIGDGCWGGHRIDFCDVFDTVKETGDHGSFNSWGRDRWWGVTDVDLDTVVNGENSQLPILDAIEPITLSNTRWRCDHGWDIDLDDGSSNYHIYNNLCLNGGLKLREGFYRSCENNILVNNTLHPHVWYNDSHDIFRNNIVFAPYRPIQMREWTQQIDFNLLHTPGQQAPTAAEALQKLSGHDAYSLQADAGFVDAAAGDYRVNPDSQALKLGFVNFNMQQFGVQSPALKAIARQPQLPTGLAASSATFSETRSRQVIPWAGAKVRNIVGLGEVSAAGTPGEVGVILLEVTPNSLADKAGFTKGDILLAINNKPTKSIEDLQQATEEAAPGEKISVKILRFQQESVIQIAPN